MIWRCQLIGGRYWAAIMKQVGEQPAGVDGGEIRDAATAAANADSPDRPATDDGAVGLLPCVVVVGEGLRDLRSTAFAVRSVEADELGPRADGEQRVDCFVDVLSAPPN